MLHNSPKVSKPDNSTLTPGTIDPLVPDANSLMATLMDITRAITPTKAEKLYRYTSGQVVAAGVASLKMTTTPDYWIVDVFGSGANTDFTIYEEGTPIYYGTAINGKVKVVIPANSRTVNLTKTGNDVYYILAGCIGYEPENLL